MKNIAVFASGNGTNAERLIGHFSSSPMGRVRLVATENPHAGVLARAQRLQVPQLVFTMNELRNGQVMSKLADMQIDFIVLAGFLKLMPEALVEAFAGRIVNIHPALLPKFGGKGMYGDRVHRAVIAAHEAQSGITIHFVNSHYDEGSTIAQFTCPVLPTDTPESLAQRVHQLEYAHYPEVVETLLASAR